MRNPGGYAFISSPTTSKVNLDGLRVDIARSGISEYDTFSCKHCGAVRHVKAKERPEDLGGLCKQCMGLICPSCLDEGRCSPLERKIEEMEQRDYLRRSNGWW